MLLGLRIKVKTVTGKVNKNNAICEELLGYDFFEEAARGQCIYLRHLTNHYKNLLLTEDSTENEKIIKTRCYIMILFGLLFISKKY